MANPPPKKVVDPISEPARLQSLRETMARAPEPDCIRVFGYASLMWNPCFEIVEAKKGSLHGYRRACSIWSVFARGTPDRPGLGFALEESDGEYCDGVVFTLPPTTCEEDLLPLWEREMWTDAYRTEWVKVSVDGSDICALTFLIRRDHPQYAGDLSIEEQAAYIASASGKYGACHSYVEETFNALRAQGVDDPQLKDLLEAVKELRRA